VDVVEGRESVRAALSPCGKDVDLLAAGSGVPRMSEMSSYELHLLATGLREVEDEYRYVLIDSAAGVSHQTLAFARASDATLVVTTPDLTAMTDAYAFLKLLFAGRAGTRALLLVNRAASAEEAEEVTRRIARVGERFLGMAPRCIGWLPHDRAVSACVNRRGSVVALEPGAEVSRSLRLIAVALAEELGQVQGKGLGTELLREVGYATRPDAKSAARSVRLKPA
jgi:flagellar biosynthesis protein FlhG